MAAASRSSGTTARYGGLLVVALSLSLAVWFLLGGDSPGDVSISDGRGERTDDSSPTLLPTQGEAESPEPLHLALPEAPTFRPDPQTAPPTQPLRQYARRIALTDDGTAVHSRVFEADGTPVAGATVTVYGEAFNDYHGILVSPSFTATTDSDGHFDLQLGSAWSWATLRMGVLVEGRRRFLGRLVPSGGQPDIVLSPDQSLAVRLLFDDGSPVTGARVHDGHPWLNAFDAEPEIRALWDLGITDTDGRTNVPITDDVQWLQLRFEHDTVGEGERVSVDLDAWRDAGQRDVLEWVLPQLACLEVELIGNQQDWHYATGLGLHLEQLERDPPGSHPAALGGNDYGTSSGRSSYAEKRSSFDAPFVFPRLTHFEMRVAHNVRGLEPLVLRDRVTLQPGTTRLTLELPTLPAYTPGDTWWLQVSLVDPSGAVLDRNHARQPVVMPRLLATGRDGQTIRETIDSHSGGTWIHGELVPPVQLSFADFPSAPTIDGIEPGDRVRLVWDRSVVAPHFGTLSVTLTDNAQPTVSSPRIELTPADGLGKATRFELPLSVQIPAGSWTYKVFGRHTDEATGTFALQPAGLVELSATLSADRPVPKPQGGTIIGYVTVLSDDPWVVPADVRSEPQEDTGSSRTHESRVKHGAFHLTRLAAGTHRLTATATRFADIEKSRANMPDLTFWQVPNHPLASMTRDVHVMDGETKVVNFEIDMHGKFGLVVLELPPPKAGAPLAKLTISDSSGDTTVYRDDEFALTVLDAAGDVVKESAFGPWPRDGYAFALPSGSYSVELRAAFGREATFAARRHLGKDAPLPPASWTARGEVELQPAIGEPVRVVMERRWRAEGDG